MVQPRLPGRTARLPTMVKEGKTDFEFLLIKSLPPCNNDCPDVRLGAKRKCSAFDSKAEQAVKNASVGGASTANQFGRTEKGHFSLSPAITEPHLFVSWRVSVASSTPRAKSNPWGPRSRRSRVEKSRIARPSGAQNLAQDSFPGPRFRLPWAILDSSLREQICT